MGKVLGSPVRVTSTNVYVHEDNSGTLILDGTLPQKFMPRSKYNATKTIWFHKEINKRKIAFLKVAKVEQLGDLFTKNLPRATFEWVGNYFPFLRT